MNECCKICNYSFEVRERSSAYQKALTKICALFLIQENCGYILEVDDNDVCECYMEYDGKYEKY